MSVAAEGYYKLLAHENGVHNTPPMRAKASRWRLPSGSGYSSSLLRRMRPPASGFFVIT